MQKALFLLALSVSMAFGQTSVDLDAPATKKITVRTELERGHSAVFDCTLKQLPTDFDAAERCTFSILDDNKQKNTDTDAFVLGVYFQTWSKIASLYTILQDRPDRGTRGIASLTDKTRFWFKQFREKQKEMGIDDKTLCSVLKTNYDIIKVRIEFWAKDAAGEPVAASAIAPSEKKFRAGIRFLPVGKTLQVVLAEPDSPNIKLVGKFIMSIEGEKGAGLDLQAKLAAVIAKHQDGTPVKITLSDGPGKQEREGVLVLAAF